MRYQSNLSHRDVKSGHEETNENLARRSRSLRRMTFDKQASLLLVHKTIADRAIFEAS